MANEKLVINVALQIMRNPHDVFDAIVDPLQMSNYFISTSSGRMESGAKITWRFPEFDLDFPIVVKQVIPDKYIGYTWQIGGQDMLVEILLEDFAGSTVVRISEKEMSNGEAGIQWLKGNTEGWANFLACLKAWLEYGVHLRRHAFDFRQDKQTAS